MQLTLHGIETLNKNKLAILPRGGLGDILYHALLAKHVEAALSEFRPVLLAPKFGAFIASLVGTTHLPVSSILTAASLGFNLQSETEFFGAFLRFRGGYLASFTNDVVDNSIAHLFGIRLFDGGQLGNAALDFDSAPGGSLRSRLSRLLGYNRAGCANPKHILARQQYALAQHGAEGPVAVAYQKLWKEIVLDQIVGSPEQEMVLLFPETARLERNLSFEQIQSIVTRLRPHYNLRIFTRYPDLYKSLNIETAGFEDRMEPLRQINTAAAVITADTFSAHLAGLCGVPTYTIYNFAYKPRWCEYWGAPFDNVLHFESGECLRLNPDFSGVPAAEDSLLFEAALQASSQTPSLTSHQPSQILAGCAVR